jgi:serine/threonine-protein kinase HipA
VQLKLSAVRAGRGPTIPAHGRGGDWIVKLPDWRHPAVPENEWAMMTFSRKSGMDHVELVPISDVAGLPPDLTLGPEVNALAVRRFDRQSGARIHIEDFAQVLDVRPTHRDKYGTANFETLARIVSRVAPESVEEFVRRLVFNVAIGNGDAHIKDWSFRYSDPMRASLAPAYDLVSTIQYLPDDELGLNLAGSRAFSDVTWRSLARLGQKAELAIDPLHVARKAVARIRSEWATHREVVADHLVRRIEAHWRAVPLMNE